MEGRSPREPLTLVDFLDVALLGSIALVAGISLLPPPGAGTVPPGSGAVERTLVMIVEMLQSATGPLETLGFVLTVTGGVMVVIGPLWVLVVRPLNRRGYL